MPSLEEHINYVKKVLYPLLENQVHIKAKYPKSHS